MSDFATLLWACSILCYPEWVDFCLCGETLHVLHSGLWSFGFLRVPPGSQQCGIHTMTLCFH